MILADNQHMLSNTILWNIVYVVSPRRGYSSEQQKQNNFIEMIHSFS